jgi:PAS domain S-box-containing protein
VHQIELEMQTKELMLARSAAQVVTEKYTELFDFAPPGYFTLSAAGKIIELNLTGAKMLGKERSHLINNRFGLFVSEDTKSTFNQFLDKVFSSKAKETCEVTLSNNGNLPVFVHLTGIAAENGEKCLVIVVDITERKEAEENLRQSEDSYRSIFQGSADGIMIADEENQMILFANSAQCQMFGYTEEQLKTMNISEIHPEDTFQYTLAEFGRQARGEKTLAENIQCLKKNGEIFYSDINSSIISINGRKHVLGFFRDVTDRRKAEKRFLKFRNHFRRRKNMP